jgi:hypothetical protein
MQTPPLNAQANRPVPLYSTCSPSVTPVQANGGSQSVFLGPAASAPSGNLLETQSFRPQQIRNCEKAEAKVFVLTSSPKVLSYIQVPE